jgi:hypothetical protein
LRYLPVVRSKSNPLHFGHPPMSATSLNTYYSTSNHNNFSIFLIVICDKVKTIVTVLSEFNNISFWSLAAIWAFLIALILALILANLEFRLV